MVLCINKCMKTFNEFMALNEAADKKASKKENKDDTNKIDCVMDLAKAIQDVFKDYTLNTRKEAWKRINSAKAKDLFQKMLVTPSRSLSPFKNIATDK